MSGFIVKETIVANKELVVSLYGIRVYEACLTAGPNTTFLGILIALGVL
jgi:hypothetical protein